MTRQVGIDMTDADYFAFLDSDDMLMPYTVETWKNAATIYSNFDIFHSYFFEQTQNEIILQTEGHTWCHGKLYKTSFIKKYNIKNSPNVKYADDVYFNSICTSLGKYGEIPAILYFYAYNSNSIIRNSNSTYRTDGLKDFLHALRLCVQFIKSKEGKNLYHIENTIKGIKKEIDQADESTKIEFELLVKEFYEGTK